MRARFMLRGAAVCAAWVCAPAAFATHEQADKDLGVVTIRGSAPSSLPSAIPTTMEAITQEQIEQSINASDSEDALRYFPSLLVRKRYIGDYNHAVLSSRASGTGNSARSAVYADGILLSNYLGNGATFAPRWGLVTPEEIERVDVMYGPFSAAYPGNSVGAVVDYQTRMPKALEAHVKAGWVSQPFDLYNTHGNFGAAQASASLGSREGNWSWWINLNRNNSHGQPLTFATRLKSAGAASSAGTAVSGAVLDANNANAPWFNLGTGTEYTTLQDHGKLKLAYDINPGLRASYSYGVWRNTSEGRPATYLRDANGQPVYSGAINIGGLSYSGSSALSGADYVLSNENLTHAMQALSLRSHSRGVFDWELAASEYRYAQDSNRRNSAANVLPAAQNGGAGSLADGAGTGWTALAAKGIWRPNAAHVVDFGAQRERFVLSSVTSNLANWQTDSAGTMANAVRGTTETQSLYAQDAWGFAPRWKTVLGLRLENWSARDGQTFFGVGKPDNRNYDSREESHASPKAALSYQWADDTVLKASLGRAVRFATVNELYGATATTNSKYLNDPLLRPEKSWTLELTAEKDLGHAQARWTLFAEDTRDALYSQLTFDAAANTNITRVQNIERIATQGMEFAFQGENVWRHGLDLSASLTWTDSVIRDNAGFVATPGDTLGKRQPNIPAWRASALASYRWDAAWVASLGLRYSGPQFRTLNNADVNGYTYQGVSEFFVADVRLRYRHDKHWSAAVGIDNLGNYPYWNFHPYPQRSYVAELRFDL